VIIKIDEGIHAHELYLGQIDHFKAILNQVLSTRFTAERANANTHKLQSNFSSLSPLPDLLESFVNKRIEILRLIRIGLGYIAAGESNDFKPADASRLQSLVGEVRTLETRAIALLQDVNFS
jgi:hypothetical protein